MMPSSRATIGGKCLLRSTMMMMRWPMRCRVKMRYDAMCVVVVWYGSIVQVWCCWLWEQWWCAVTVLCKGAM
ncbi:Hypothetical predicted protein, partial [Olea europaea subsp. europaea]